MGRTQRETVDVEDEDLGDEDTGEELPSFEIPIGTSGMVVASINDYKGKLSLDVRYYYLDKNSNEFKPSPKGTGVPLDQAKKFAIRLKKLVQKAEEMGLLPE